MVKSYNKCVNNITNGPYLNCDKTKAHLKPKAMSCQQSIKNNKIKIQNNKNTDEMKKQDAARVKVCVCDKRIGGKVCANGGGEGRGCQN